MTCLRKNSSVLGLITTRNKDLGSEYAIKSTRSCHVETVVCLSQLSTTISTEVIFDKDSITATEAKATYSQIKQYVRDMYGYNVSTLYIAQIKAKHGIKIAENYNKAKNTDGKTPICPAAKEKAIEDALRHFLMIK